MRNKYVPLLSIAAPLLLILGACQQNVNEAAALPAVDEYCLTAQLVVTKTPVAMQLVVHDDFDAFVKSKAVIEGPEIQQFNWYDEAGNLQGISCKLKSADHLNMAFGEGSAGPDGLCQDMNWQVYKTLRQQIDAPVYDPVTFDLNEQLMNSEQSPMTGPDWLAPFTLTYLDDADGLHVATKGFTVNFGDPRWAKAPDRFRGVHYCHLIAPEYLAGLMRGEADPGAVIGRVVEARMPTE